MSAASELKHAPSGASDMAHIVLTFDNNKHAGTLYGQFDENLARIEQMLGVDIRSKGNQLSIKGDPIAAEQARRALDYLYERLQKGTEVAPSDVDGAVRMAIAADDQLSLPTLERKGKLAAAQISTRKRTIYARSVNQDAYMRAMERAELVFGIGPAGTGKTYLAVAYAAMLLERGMVERIVLSRPAVEAGERLGFLPGDMKEKVDPYLRPLYDALYDMMPPDKVERAIAAEVIEIAARLHARPHAAQRGDHPRRGAKHHADADEDVPDPPGRERPHDRHRRSEPDRPAPQHEIGAGGGAARAGRRARHRHRALRRQGRGAPSAGGRDRQGL